MRELLIERQQQNADAIMALIGNESGPLVQRFMNDEETRKEIIDLYVASQAAAADLVDDESPTTQKDFFAIQVMAVVGMIDLLMTRMKLDGALPDLIQLQALVGTIEDLWPADCEMEDTAADGQAMLDAARKAAAPADWRDEPLPVLERYAAACLDKEHGNMRRADEEYAAQGGVL